MHGCACDPGPPAAHTARGLARVARRGGQQVRTRNPRCPATTRIRAAVLAARMPMEDPSGSL